MPRSQWQLVFTFVLVAFSTYFAIVAYPYRAWLMATSMGAVAFSAIVFRVGWVIPCTAAGVYAGMIMDAGVKGGTIESQMWETVTSICVGAIAGCVVGLVIDSEKRRKHATQQ